MEDGTLFSLTDGVGNSARRGTAQTFGASGLTAAFRLLSCCASSAWISATQVAPPLLRTSRVPADRPAHHLILILSTQGSRSKPPLTRLPACQAAWLGGLSSVGDRPRNYPGERETPNKAVLNNRLPDATRNRRVARSPSLHSRRRSQAGGVRPQTFGHFSLGWVILSDAVAVAP